MLIHAEIWLWKNISDLAKGTSDLGTRAVPTVLMFTEKKNTNKQTSTPGLTGDV